MLADMVGCCPATANDTPGSYDAPTLTPDVLRHAKAFAETAEDDNVLPAPERDGKNVAAAALDMLGVDISRLKTARQLRNYYAAQLRDTDRVVSKLVLRIKIQDHQFTYNKYFGLLLSDEATLKHDAVSWYGCDYDPVSDRSVAIEPDATVICRALHTASLKMGPGVQYLTPDEMSMLAAINARAAAAVDR